MVAVGVAVIAAAAAAAAAAADNAEVQSFHIKLLIFPLELIQLFFRLYVYSRFRIINRSSL